MSHGPGALSVQLDEGCELLAQSKKQIRRFNRTRKENVLAEKLFNLPISKFPELVAMEEIIKKYYPFDEIKEKIWKYDTIFNERHALLIQTVQQTDCTFRCGSVAQTEILSNGAMTKNSFPVYFYQYSIP